LSSARKVEGANGAKAGQGRHRPRTSRDQNAIAALDLGTNNCRLLVARPTAESFEVVDAFSRPVRLGEGVEASNQLSDAAQERAIKALRICAGKIRHHRARGRRIIATEACRRASNARPFLNRVARETGLHVEVIGAEEEARLAVAGCAPLIDPEAEQLLVFDIGGGSTELIWVDMADTAPEDRRALIRGLSPPGGLDHAGLAPDAAPITDWISVPMGVSTLCERFAPIEDEGERFRCMARLFEDRLSSFAPYGTVDRAAQTGKLQIIGVSGTATTFGALHLGLRNYNRSRVDGLWLPSIGAESVAGWLLNMGLAGRSAHPGIGAGRAGLVLAGAAILMTILRIWPVARMRIADRGLREGMLYGLIQEQRARSG